MEFRRVVTLFLVIVVCMAVVAVETVEATRVLSGNFACDNHLAAYPSMYDKARSFMDCWVGRLAAGPSPKGPGH